MKKNKRFIVFCIHPETGEYLLVRGCWAKDSASAVLKVLGKNANINKYVALDAADKTQMAYLEERRQALSMIAAG